MLPVHLHDGCLIAEVKSVGCREASFMLNVVATVVASVVAMVASLTRASPARNAYTQDITQGILHQKELPSCSMVVAMLVAMVASSARAPPAKHTYTWVVTPYYNRALMSSTAMPRDKTKVSSKYQGRPNDGMSSDNTTHMSNHGALLPQVA